ncbi:restriction endonuclease subunit S [Acinetobacter schindleri]|uniref:restriction endonuclease subunit S n=1 Tax=Acinetobacter schindleri TaxID=108981 RepID=UPI003F561A80
MSSDKKLLSDFATVISGYAFKSEWFGTGNDKVIRIGDLQEGSIQTEAALTVDASQYKISDNFKIQNKDILMALSGATVGKIAVASDADVGSYINQRVAIIRAKDEITADYLKFFFSGEFLDDLLKNAGGAAQPNLSPKQLLLMEIPFPPLAEQRRIASILDQADELRQKRQQAIEKLDQLLQATFIDMFGDPVSNPKGWQIEPLKNNILHANNGLSRRRKELENVGDIVLRLQDVHYDGIHFDKELNRISLDDSEKKRFSVDEGDILFIRVNGNPEYVGRSAVFSGYKEPIFHNDHLIRIKLSERYIPNFLSYCFNTPQGKNIISKQIKTSAGQHTVSQGGIEIMKFYIPPIKLQEQWTNLYLKIEDQKKKLNEQLDMQNQLFSSLQNQAFNGTL